LFDSAAGGPCEWFPLLYYIILGNPRHLINVEAAAETHSLLIYLELRLVQRLRFFVSRVHFCLISRIRDSMKKFILMMVRKHVFKEQRRAIAR